MSSILNAGILCALGVLAWSACANPTMPDSNDVTLTEAQNGQSVSAPIGATIRVRLPATPGTGYGWQLAGLDREALQPAGEETLQSAGQPGAASLVEYRFKALKAGTTRLRLEYRRPWEQDKEPARVFSTTVEVMPARQR